MTHGNYLFSLQNPLLISVPNSETGIEKKDALICPSSKVTMIWAVETLDITLQFLEHVEKTRRRTNSWFDGETKTMSLTRTMVGILPQDDHFYVTNLDTGRP